MRNIWNSYSNLIVTNCTNRAIDRTSLDYWRNELFATTIIYIIPLSFIAIIPGIHMAYLTELSYLIFVDVVAMIAVLAVAFVPNIPIFARKIIFNAALYLVSIALLYYLGSFGPGLLYLLATTFFVIVSLDQKYAYAAVLLNILICIWIGLAIVYDFGMHMVLSDYDIGSWIAVSVNLIFLSAVSVFLIPRLFHGLQTSINEQKDLKKQLSQKKSELETSIQQVNEKNRELEEFAYTVSHDLKEPLRMVKSFVGLLEKKYKNKIDDKADQYIHFAVDGATRMQTLIDDLLTYSRVGRHRRDKQLIEIPGLIDEVVVNLNTLIEENETEIKVDEKIPEIIGYRNEMVRLFQNLISNAIKFSRKDVSPLVRISGSENEENWHLKVIDNGIGMTQKECLEVFDIFKQANHKKVYPGTGIGLAICRKVVHQHNGKIFAESEPNQGSTFHIILNKSK